MCEHFSASEGVIFEGKTRMLQVELAHFHLLDYDSFHRCHMDCRTRQMVQNH